MRSEVDVKELDPSKIRDISPEALDGDGRLKVLPAAYWAGTTPDERALFGVNHGLYSFPTVELVEHLREVIGDRKAIEIGAGHGVLADALGIVATDNFQQRMPKYRAHYEQALRQPIVSYGPNVEDLDAKQAVRRYRPQVVIGCWVTHKYDPKRHFAGGNEIGVDENELLRQVETYVVVGNQKVHRHKAIWAVPHEIEHPDWVYSRAWNGTPDFVARWGQS